MPARKVQYLNPEGASPAQGLYSHIGKVDSGPLLFIAGQLAVDARGEVVGKHDFDAQFQQVFDNLGAVLKGAGASFDDVIKFTTYLVHSQDIEKFMKARGAVSEAVRQRSVSSQHTAGRGSLGQRGVFDRGGGRGACRLKPARRAS